MSDQVDVRAADPDDIERIRTLTESSMTSSYAMSPREIEAVVEAKFGGEELDRRLDAADEFVLVAEHEGTVSGVVVGTVEDSTGTVRHLHVDPERRGRGAGTRLFEELADELRDEGAADLRAAALTAATEGGEFYGKFGFEATGERSVEVGGISTAEYLYTRTDGESASEARTDTSSAPDESPDLPETISRPDGETVYVGADLLSGTDGAFAPTYADSEHHEEFGYYCVNCESTDVSMGSSDRLVCGDCGNTRQPNEHYDGSYL